MGHNKKLKPPQITQKSGPVGIKAEDILFSNKVNYPVFCFRHLKDGYDIENCCQCSDDKFLKGLVRKIFQLSKLSWDDIKLSGRKGVGSEKISKSSLLITPPSSITDDVKDYLSFYFAGDNGRIIGYRSQYAFHVVFIDTKLNVYAHS
jgi:hypothetical protein